MNAICRLMTGRQIALLLAGACLLVYLIAWMLEGGLHMGSYADLVNFVETTTTPAQESGNGASGKAWTATKMRKYTGLQLFSNGKHQDFSSQSQFPRQSQQCKRWIVITTIFAPTEIANQAAKLKGWCTVIVGDSKTPVNAWKDYAGRYQTFLDVQSQLDLPYELVKLTPMKHFGRKNLGYLYAIHHGAEIIYDTDDDNALLDNGSKLLKWTNVMEDVPRFNTSTAPKLFKWRAQSRVFNPYRKFNLSLQIENGDRGPAQFGWPRGFPLSRIQDSKTVLENVTRNQELFPAKQVGFIQFLVNHDPDMDALYRLTRPLPLVYHVQNVAYAVEKGVLFPANAQATLFRYEAFFSLMLPITVHGRVSDIWRSYMAQALLWNSGFVAAYGEPLVEQQRNSHSYLADLDSEQPLYRQADELTRYLQQWKSSQTNLAGQYEEMVIAMYEIGALELDDVKYVQAWLGDLMRCGYRFPELINNAEPRFQMNKEDAPPDSLAEHHAANENTC